MKALLLALMMVAGTHAFADADKHPCEALKKACEAAGFHKGGHKEGKGLYIDCLGKINKGESVPGVNINAADVAACKEKRAAKGK